MLSTEHDDQRPQLGWFWLPDHPEERVPGIVESDENSIWLRLLGMFEQVRAPSYTLPSDVLHSAAFGELQNPDEIYTLHGANLWIPGPRYSVLRAGAGVAGAHNSDDQLVSRVRFRMDLDLLVARPLTEAIYSGDVDLVARVDLLKVPPLEITIPNGSVRVNVHPVIRPGQPGKSVEFDASHQIDVVFTNPVTWMTLGRHAIQPLRQLIAPMTAARPTVHDVSFASEGDPTDPVGSHLARQLDWPTWLRGRVAPTGRNVHLTAGRIRRWEGADLDVDVLLQRWWAWATHEENGRVLNALNRTAQTDHRSDRDEFSDAISAVEEYANRFEPDRQVHRARVSRLMAHILEDDADRSWAEGRLRSGGGAGFMAKLKMVRDANAAGSRLLGDDTALEQMATARHELSHGDYPSGYDLRDVARQIREYIAVLAVTEA